MYVKENNWFVSGLSDCLQIVLHVISLIVVTARHNWYKDVALVTALAVAIGGCWLAYRQNKELEVKLI